MGVAEVTEPVEIDAVGDRLFFTVISGEDRKTYSLSFHRARNAAMVAMALLDRQDRERHGSVRHIAGH